MQLTKTLSIALSVLLFINCKAQQIENPLIRQLRQQVKDKNYLKIDAVIISHRGKVIVEEYFNGFDRDTGHDTRSSFKSVTSLLAGIAIDQKLFTLDDPLEKFFPELQDEGKRKITVRNLLEMRSGLNCEEVYEIGPECETEMTKTDDWVAFCLGVPLIRQPGLNWSYNSNEPMLVGEIIARASKMSVMDFATRNLFQPLGIEDYKWTISPKGQGMTAGSFYMKPMDMMKIAELVRSKGSLNGRQLISKKWIETATDCHIPIDFSFVRYARIPNAKYESALYGLFWYRERLRYRDIDTEILFASGNGGQYMMVIPEYDMTAVFTGSNYGNWRGKLPFELLLKYIIPDIARK